MTDSHFLSRLKELWAEKSGELEKAREEVARLEGLVVHYSAVLKDQAPDFNTAELKPVRRRKASNSDGGGRSRDSSDRAPVTQDILIILRDEDMPMTADEIAQTLSRVRNDPDVKKLKGSVHTFMHVKVKEGLIAKHERTDGVAAYTINRTRAAA
jgi:hypothetical protein